jgi:hypothetical protein
MSNRGRVALAPARRIVLFSPDSCSTPSRSKWYLQRSSAECQLPRHESWTTQLMPASIAARTAFVVCVVPPSTAMRYMAWAFRHRAFLRPRIVEVGKHDLDPGRRWASRSLSRVITLTGLPASMSRSTTARPTFPLLLCLGTRPNSSIWLAPIRPDASSSSARSGSDPLVNILPAASARTNKARTSRA